MSEERANGSGGAAGGAGGKGAGLGAGAAGSAALSALMRRAEALGGGSAPVEAWNPPDCGPIPMRIDRGGTWHYAGTPIARERMVRLFASILRREGERHFVLVTPVEKVTIDVEDVPFQGVELAIEGEREGQTVTVRTNVGDVVTVGPGHPLRFGLEEGTDGLVPYVTVRRGLEARLTRAATLELVDTAVERDGALGIWSDGAFTALPNASGAGNDGGAGGSSTCGAGSPPDGAVDRGGSAQR